jgi:hypothetical protein
LLKLGYYYREADVMRLLIREKTEKKFIEYIYGWMYVCMCGMYMHRKYSKEAVI